MHGLGGHGVIWTVGGGLLSSRAFGNPHPGDAAGEMTFVQINDSHIGFNKTAPSS
jgi:Icc protein